MQKIISFFLILQVASFGISTKEAYQKGEYYEKKGDIKKALFWYKKSATIHLDKIKKSRVLEKKELIKVKKKGNFLLPFEPYKTNYILLGSYNSVKHSDRKRFETKFQISIKKKLFADIFGFKNQLYFGYTQKSFWQTSKKSSPFRETNYAPEFFLNIPHNHNNSFLKSYKIGLLHESNGRGGIYSRSWNRIYMQGFFDFKNITVSPRIWYRIPERKKSSPLDANGDDNPDIWKYLGYGDIKIVIPYKKNIFSLTLKDNLRSSDNKGSILFDWSFPVTKSNIYLYLQLFSGYGESLIDYNKRNNKIGIGFAISR